MVVGLPGTGIGGLFYLMITLWMPVHAAWLKVRGIKTRALWPDISRLSFFATGIIGGMWATGWALAQFFIAFNDYLPVWLRLSQVQMSAHMANIWGIISVVMSVGTLSCVALSVHLLRYHVRRSKRLVPAPAMVANWHGKN